MSIKGERPTKRVEDPEANIRYRQKLEDLYARRISMEDFVDWIRKENGDDTVADGSR